MGLVCQALHPEYCFSVIANVEGGVGGVYAHLNGIKPGSLLIGTERSPLSPYLWRTTVAQGYCRPKDDQSNRKD